MSSELNLRATTMARQRQVNSSTHVRAWLGRIGVKTLFIEPGSPWENGFCESFNSKLRDELLAGELFSTL